MTERDLCALLALHDDPLTLYPEAHEERAYHLEVSMSDQKTPRSNSLEDITPLLAYSDRLSRTERLAIRLISYINRPSLGHRIGTTWGRGLQALFNLALRHRFRFRGREHLQEIPRDASILLVANHRTFFDLFVGTTALRQVTRNRLGDPCCFPVRSPFFFDHPLGLVVNLLFSGGCMYPPVFRDARKAELNSAGFETMQRLLERPGLCFGLHPEGRRSKSIDPFEIEPLRPGVGRLITQARPDLYVLPMFIEGLSNRAGAEVKQAFWRSRATPIYLRWGEARRASEYPADEALATQKVSAQLRALADLQRAERVNRSGD